MFRPLVCAATLCFSASAFAEPVSENLTPGEMYGHIGGYTGNAWTAPKGSLYLHPFLRSTAGLTDNVDVKVSALGFLGGPNANVEFAPVQSDDQALSVEAGVQSTWGFGFIRYNSFFRYGKVAGNGVFNLSVGVGGVSGSIGDANSGVNINISDPISFVRPEIGYDFILSERSRFVTTARTNIVNFTRGAPTGAVGGLWFYGNGLIGASLGVNVLLGGFGSDTVDAFDDANITVPAVFIIPVPHAQIWFRI